jgi:hypothetical protein
MIVRTEGRPFLGDVVETTGAVRVEVRDQFGQLLVFCVQMKDENAVFVFRRGDEDFEWSAKTHSVDLVSSVGTIISPSNSGLILG